MHISSTSSNQSILACDKRFIASAVLESLNIDEWPFPIKGLPKGSALVGGSIRDLLLERAQRRKDLDLVVPNQAIDLARNYAKSLNGTFVLLDEKREIARLVVGDWTIDFATRVGSCLENDLLRRDFKLNAIALTLDSAPKLIDPTGGLDELKQKRISAVSEQNLLDDPLRLLRALRLMAELNLTLETRTRKWIEHHHALLLQVAPERIQGELKNLVQSRWADEAIRVLKELGLLTFWGNSEDEFKKAAPSLANCQNLRPQELIEALPLLRLTNLLSDRGLEQLRFSRKQCKKCQLLRKWQLRNDGLAFQTLNEADRLALHEDLEEDLPALKVDLLPNEQISWLQRWRDRDDPLFHPASPVNGRVLQDSLGLEPGPKLGEVIRYLCHERAFGRLRNREDALKAACYFIEQN